MAGTLTDMKARIAREMARTDLSNQIADAINDAIAVYSQERFSFSEDMADGTWSMNTVAGRTVYTDADLPILSSSYRIDNINALIGATAIRELVRKDPNELLLYNQRTGTINGQPMWFAYENGKLLISPAPDKAYQLNFSVFRNIAAPASDTEAGNPWMTTAERLIRARAKFELATHVTRNPTMAQAMSPSLPIENQGMVGAAYREWKQMKGTANRRTSRGRVRPVQF